MLFAQTCEIITRDEVHWPSLSLRKHVVTGVTGGAGAIRNANGSFRVHGALV